MNDALDRVELPGLDLGEIEAGKMDLHLESFAIASLVEDVVMTIRPLAEKNGNRLTVECPPDIGTMRADPTRVRQALLNLTSNAAKFTERGAITVSAMRRRQFLVELRSRPGGRDIPVLVVTAKDLTEDDRRRLNGGVERVIMKRGYAPDELLRELGHALAACVERRRASSTPASA